MKTKLFYIILFIGLNIFAAELSKSEQEELVKNLDMLMEYDLISHDTNLDVKKVNKQVIKKDKKGAEDV